MATVLSEPDRLRLAALIGRMETGGETDDNIRTAIASFKEKYGQPDVSPEDKVKASREKLIAANEAYKKNPPAMEHPNLADEFIRGAAGYGVPGDPTDPSLRNAKGTPFNKVAGAYMRNGPGQIVQGVSDLGLHMGSLGNPEVDNLSKGGNKILRGAGVTALPFAPAAAVAAPAAFAASIPLGMGGGAVGYGGAKYAGADEETAQFLGTLASIAAGSQGGRAAGGVGRLLQGTGDYIPTSPMSGTGWKLGKKGVTDLGRLMQRNGSLDVDLGQLFGGGAPPSPPPPAAMTTGTAFPMPRPMSPSPAPGPVPPSIPPAQPPMAQGGWSVPPSPPRPTLTPQALATIPEAVPASQWFQMLQGLRVEERPLAMKWRAQFVAEHPGLNAQAARAASAADLKGRVAQSVAAQQASTPEPIARPVAPPPVAPVAAAPAAAEAAPVVAATAAPPVVPVKVATPPIEIPPTPPGDLPPHMSTNWQANPENELAIQRVRQKLPTRLSNAEVKRGLDLIAAGKAPNEAVAILKQERVAEPLAGGSEPEPAPQAAPAKAEPAKAEPAKAAPEKTTAGVKLTPKEATELTQADLKSDGMDLYHDLRVKGIDHDAALAQTKLTLQWRNKMGQGTLVDMANRIAERERTGDWPENK